MRTFLAAGCAVLFIVSLPAAILLTNAENLLFRSATYKDALQTTGLYTRLPALISRHVVSDLPGGPSGPLQILTTQDWQILIGTSVPPETLRVMTEQTLDQVFDTLDGKSSSVSVPLVSFKQEFGPKSAEALRRVLATKPACTPDRLIAIALQIASGKLTPQGALCSPPPELLSVFLPLLGQGLQSEIAALPDRLTIFTTAERPDLVPTVQHIRLVMRLSLLVPIAFVVFMTLWAVHSIHGLLRWWGPALILAGALGLLAGLANAPLIGLALAVGLPYLPPPAPELIESAPDVVLALGHAVAVPVMAQSVLVLLAGVILSLVALVLHSRQHRRQTGNAASGR